MSCSENESGPFVVFFLPALVGCLTILLARRWANSQVSNTSSTAVSRRRKIIKDPLIKRPLPPIACKMVAPTSKKPAGGAKKGSISTADEDTNGVGKRVTRTSRLSPSSSSGSAPEVKPSLDLPPPPKHIPFPPIPQDGELLFECMMFVFNLVAMCLQFLNLYRTIWWLPHSTNTSAVNFYLIDVHLVGFIVTIVSRRLLFSLSLLTLKNILPPKLIPHVTQTSRFFALSLIFGALSWFMYSIATKFPLIKIFYISYPAVVYFLLFGFELSPFLEISNSETPPLHNCSHDPEQVRAEVDNLRQDFNLRVKKIIFNAVVDAYYTSFIPCCFAQSYLYYDAICSAQQTALWCGGAGARYCGATLPPSALDAPHRAARHLGRWEQIKEQLSDESADLTWSSEKYYNKGTMVVYHGSVYSAVAPLVAAEPGNSGHSRFYSVFINPSKMLCLLLCLQLSLIFVQIVLLFSSIEWHYFIALVIMLFINYYSLFKTLRDYLIAWKVYKAENMIQDKTSVGTQSVSN